MLLNAGGYFALQKRKIPTQGTSNGHQMRLGLIKSAIDTGQRSVLRVGVVQTHMSI